MGYKSRWGFPNPVCLLVDCINKGSETCKDCLPMFDYKNKLGEGYSQMLKRRASGEKGSNNDDLREVQE